MDDDLKKELEKLEEKKVYWDGSRGTLRLHPRKLTKAQRKAVKKATHKKAHYRSTR